MRNLSKKAKTIIAGAAIAGLASTGVAYAYWTTTGSGTGGAATTGTTATPMTIAQFGVVDGLILGGAVGTVSVKATNPATFSQSIGDITATPTYPGACDSTNWTITHLPNGPTTLATLGVSGPIDVATVALIDKPGVDQNGCKTATVTFTFASS